MQALSRRGLQSPSSLIRLMVQQSNCFIVVDRGMGMQNLMQERDLAGSGELREGANLGGYINVQGGVAAGWVTRVLLLRR